MSPRSTRPGLQKCDYPLRGYKKQGQYLDDYKKGYFPCRRFDLVYAPVSRHLAEIVCFGEPFQDWPVHPPILNLNDWPGDGEILAISLDALDVDLERWATRQE